MPVTVRGRYLLEVPFSAGRHLLVGFHGYGELAEAQLERLRRIPGAGSWALASVQALHPFYRGRTGEVGACWMTRFEREAAIDENLGYVAAVLDDIRREHAIDRLVYAGFSQGVAMAFRAALRAGRRADGIIALGGDVPPELRALDLGAWRGLQVLLGRGRDDVLYVDAAMDADIAFLRSRPVELSSLVFEGGHEWSDAFSDAAGRLLAEVAAPDSGR